MSDRASADIRPDIGRYPVGHRPIPAAIIKLMIRQFKTRVYIFFKNKKIIESKHNIGIAKLILIKLLMDHFISQHLQYWAFLSQYYM